MAPSRTNANRVGHTHFTVKGLKFVVRDSVPLREWDVGIVREVIDGDCYGLLGLKGDGVEPQIVVDVGAHIGAFPVWVKNQWPTSHVICIEALFENFLLLQENVADYGDVQPRYGALVGNAHRQYIKFHSFRLDLASPENTGSGRVARPAEFYDEVVPALTLQNIFDQYQLDQIDLLKLDCEGSELNLLQAASNAGLLSRVGMIRGEWHTQTTRRAIVQLLERTHFCTSVVSQGDPEPGMFFADARGRRSDR